MVGFLIAGHICKETEDEEHGLKLFIPERWETAKKAAIRRTTLQNDYFFKISEKIRNTEQPAKTSMVSKYIVLCTGASVWLILAYD